MPASQPVDYVAVCRQVAGFLDREFGATVEPEVGDLSSLAIHLTALREAVSVAVQDTALDDLFTYLAFAYPNLHHALMYITATDQGRE